MLLDADIQKNLQICAYFIDTGLSLAKKVDINIY